MPHHNDFLPYGTGAGANVIDPALWNADARRLTGMEAGIAKSDAFNTVWRQSMFVAAMVAQFTADYGPSDVNDDGNLSNFENSFVAALGKAVQNLLKLFYVGDDTGSANHLIVTSVSPHLDTLGAGTLLLITKSNQTNTGAVLADILNVPNIPVKWDDGSDLTNGDWTASSPALLFYNGTNIRVLSFLHDWVSGEGINIDNVAKTISLAIHGLTALTVLNDADELPVYQAEDEGGLPGGHDRKITVGLVKSLMPTIANATKWTAYTQYALVTIAGYPYVDNVAQTLDVTGVTYLDVNIAVSIFYNDNGTVTSGGIDVVARVVLYHGVTLVFDSDIHNGAELKPGHAAPLTLRQVFLGLDPALTYTIKIIVSQGGGTVRADPLNVNNAYIVAYGGR